MAGRAAGKLALVTGAGSGIGKETALLLAREGARVAVSDIDEAAGRAVADRIGPSAAFIPLDVSREHDWQAAVAAVDQALGGLHVLVNNAGILTRNDIESADFATWRRTLDVDLDGVFLGCKHALPLMVRTVEATGSGGSIVNLSSIAGIIGARQQVAYSTAKAGVRHLTKSVALHCARKGYGIRCNSVHPGSTDTPILDDDRRRFGEKAITAREKLIPMGRIGRPIEIAYGILYLASDESSFTTASELVIDGGMTAM